MDEKTEIWKQLTQGQEKFIYYLIALSVAAIAYSVNRTTGLPLRCTQIPLGIAVLFWGVSVLFGLKRLKLGLSALFTNYSYINLLEGNVLELKIHPAMIQSIIVKLEETMSKNSNRAQCYFNWQGRLFYLGIVLFVVWHIIEMYYT